MKDASTKRIFKFLADRGIYVALIGLFVYFCFTPGFLFKDASGDYLAGRKAAETLAKQAEGGKIAVVRELGSRESSQKISGFVERARDLGLDVAAPYVNGRRGEDKLRERIAALRQAHPDLKGVFVASRSLADGASRAADGAGGGLAVAAPEKMADRKVLNLENLTKIQQQIAFIVIIAVGMTFVITTAGIDISVGCVVALSAVIIAKLVEEQNWAVPFAVLAALLASGGCGAFVGFSVTRFKVPPFIATVAMMTIVRGFARLIAENTKIFISKDVTFYRNISSAGAVFNVPIIVFVMFAILAAFHVVLTKTRFGRYVFAVGGNPEAARLSGIDVNRVLLFVYVINALLAGLVGAFMAFKYTNGNPEFGVMWELDVIAAVVVGGTSLFGGKGSALRSFIGALLIGILDNGLLLKGFSSEIIYIIKGFVILGAVLLDQLKNR